MRSLSISPALGPPADSRPPHSKHCGIMAAVSNRPTFSTTLLFGLTLVLGCSNETAPAAPPAPVATVTVVPMSAALPVGGAMRLTAWLQDDSGHSLTRAVTWASSAPAVAIVDTEGGGVGFARSSGPRPLASTGARSPMTRSARSPPELADRYFLPPVGVRRAAGTASA